ncbi:30S ribosomal protein S8 [Candidatus Berkelbacteria bacterium]|nr:30S ribosomal protein S8 [Candidatus Berkelbacteria bacterium]
MDPIANMLTQLRNATLIGQRTVTVSHSRIKQQIAKLLESHDFLKAVTSTKTETGHSELVLELLYTNDAPAIRSIRRLSTPGLRRYRKASDLPKPRGGFGIVVVSTPQGLMTTDQARRAHTGGEIICEVLS